MADSDEEGTSSKDDGGLDFTSFLFGNIGSSGELEEEFLDESTKKQLPSLGSLLADTNLTSIVREVSIEAEEKEKDDAGNEIGDGSESTNFDEKAPDAVDFSNTEEMIDDDSEDSEDDSEEDKDNEEETKEDDGKEPAGSPAPPPAPEEKDGESPGEVDSLLMPPPPPGPRAEKTATASSGIGPLAGMLPDKYKNVDVKTFFPEFKENSVLRFSKLFPIKESHKPRTWKALKKRRRKELGQEADESESKEKVRRGWDYKVPLPEDPDAYEECQSVRFHKPAVLEEEKQPEVSEPVEPEKKGPKPTDWRWGPAQYWYDMLELPEDCPNYDYGLKIRNVEEQGQIDKAVSALNASKKEEFNILDHPIPGPSASVENTTVSPGTAPKIEFHADAFHMVTQVNWEEDVIWNGEDIKHKVLSKLNSKSNAAGWVPSSMSRTAGSFSQRPGVKPELQIRLATLGKKLPENDDDTWYSIFPVENEELVYGRWEDEVIWNTEEMPKMLEPRIVALDPNDENIIIAIPDDLDPNTLPNEEPTRKIKIIQKHVKKSKLLLNRAGIISVVEEESPPPPPKNDDRDSFYIGNDEFYMPKEPASLIKVATGGTLLQHATPSVQLTAPFIPTHMGPIKLRQYHRWPMKRYSHGPLSNFTAFHGVQSLYKHQRKMEKWRTAEREEAGGGDIFLMREAKDLSGKDGDLVLFEYIEEYPPLMSFVGMCSKIKNYYKRKPDNDKGPKEFKYGELTYAHTSPFLGTMTPGQSIQAIENNMYRCPIYEHKLPNTDFIVIRTRTEFSIREVSAFFVSGQECPLYEVPGPNSKKANNFTRDFLQVFIYRLFWRSRDNPKRIKMDEIKKAFPAHSESSIRKRLKPCAEFHRTGPDSNWWVMKPGFRLPTEEEIRSMVDPEQCCSFYSMISGEQRLKDAGYGDKFILAQDDDDNEDNLKMDDEVKCAPWHTTRAYVQAMKGKCLLQLTGAADPTGSAGEGFSYVKIPNKPTNKEEQEAQPKRTVTGTDADLRKLPLKDAKAILRKNGVPEEEIKKLSRWEVIDVVRTLSTEKVKAGEEGVDSFKFSRGNRFSIAEHQERYREDCQRIFELQNKTLASDEILSSDEDETSSEEEEEDEDLDELGRNLEKMVQNKTTSSQFQREREEAERKKLQKVMMETRVESKPEKKSKDEKGKAQTEEFDIEAGQVLRITRTFKNAQGKEYTRTELVRKPLVIETYVKVRNTKNEQFIRQFATSDDQIKEEMKKEKRRIQEQLRRIKRNQEKERLGLMKLNKKKEKMKPDLKLKCGACNQVGHMRTNKACPKWTGEEGEDILDNMNVAMTLEDQEKMERKIDESSEELVNVEGTKVKFSEKVIRHAEELRRKTMQLTIRKDVLKSGKRKRAGTGKHCDYLDSKTYRPVKRRRTDPVISFSSHLETVLNELRIMPEAEAFLFPVSSKAVSNYYEVIKRPMDLQTIRENVQNRKYHSREEFLGDIHQMMENSSTFNGENSVLTINCKTIQDRVVMRFKEFEDKLMKLEKMINPLLDDNDQNALSYILDNILNEKIKTMSESWPFMKPVNKKQVKDYYEKIKEPMDLETMSKKIVSHKYHSRQEFVEDMRLIYNNSLTFNGDQSDFTLKAKSLLDTVEETLVPFAEHCESLEENIRKAQQRAIEQADLDSNGTSFTEDEPRRKRKRRHDTSSDGAEGSRLSLGNDDAGDLLDDLRYSSEEEDEDDDWDEVEDSQDAPGHQGFTISVDQSALDNIEEEDQGAIVPSFEPFAGYGAVPPTPIYNIQQGANGELWAEPDPSMSFHPSQDPNGGYTVDYTVDYSIPQEEEEEQVDENYDPTEFFSGIGGGVDHNGQSNGDGDRLQDDLAVSDDSDDEKEKEDDPMAF